MSRRRRHVAGAAGIVAQSRALEVGQVSHGAPLKYTHTHTHTEGKIRQKKEAISYKSASEGSTKVFHDGKRGRGRIGGRRRLHKTDSWSGRMHARRAQTKTRRACYNFQCQSFLVPSILGASHSWCQSAALFVLVGTSSSQYSRPGKRLLQLCPCRYHRSHRTPFQSSTTQHQEESQF